MGRSLRFWACLLALAPAASASAQVAVGVKNYQQLLYSYAAITGVSPDDSTITQYYNQSRARLPRTGRVDEVSSPMLLTAAALGGLFCQRMITNDSEVAAAQRKAHKQVDFTKAPAVALTDAVQDSVVSEYTRLFWRRDATSTEATALKSVFADAVAAGGTTPQDTATDLLPVCAAVAGSLDSLIN